jgi:ubiquinone/menaquinone biosynthesis C-methylase UbiE
MKAIRDPERNEINHLLAGSPFEGKRVLEIGCGDGYVTRGYACLAHQAVGIDLDPASLRKAQGERTKDGGNTSFLQASAEALPFPPSCFDTVLFASSL